MVDFRYAMPLVPQTSRATYEWSVRSPHDTPSDIRQILWLRFVSDESNVYTKVKTVRDAVLACMREIIIQKSICVKNDRRKCDQNIVGDVNLCVNHMQNKKRAKLINKFSGKIQESSKWLTEKIKWDLEEIFEENFSPKLLDPGKLLDINPREITTFFNQKEIKDIFTFSDFHISAQNFFDCILSNYELKNLRWNIQCLQNTEFFSSKLRWNEKEKIKIMKILWNSKPKLLQEVVKKIQIIPSNKEKLDLYLWKIDTLKNIDFVELRLILGNKL